MNDVEFVLITLFLACIVIAALIFFNHKHVANYQAAERRSRIHIVRKIDERV